MKTKQTLNATSTDLNQLIHQVTTQHHPITVHSTSDGDVVLISQADLATAQAVIRASIGRDVPFLTA